MARFYAKKPKTYRRYRSTKTYKKKTSYNRPSMAIKKYVKREISSNTENKSIQQYVVNKNVFYPAQGSSYDTDNTVLLGPQTNSLQITQGVSQSGRIGNRIKIKSCKLQGVFYPMPWSDITNPTPKPLEVRLVLFYNTATPTSVPVPRTNLFQFGSTTTNIIGDLNDIWAPVNKDTYRVLATKRFKLGISAYEGTGVNANAQAFSNNDFKYNYKLNWNITKYLIKNVKYNDNNQDPTTRKLFMQVIASPADGSVGPSGVIPMKYAYLQTMEYEDA